MPKQSEGNEHQASGHASLDSKDVSGHSFALGLRGNRFVNCHF